LTLSVCRTDIARYVWIPFCRSSYSPRCHRQAVVVHLAAAVAALVRYVGCSADFLGGGIERQPAAVSLTSHMSGLYRRNRRRLRRRRLGNKRCRLGRTTAAAVVEVAGSTNNNATQSTVSSYYRLTLLFTYVDLIYSGTCAHVAQ